MDAASFWFAIGTAIVMVGVLVVTWRNQTTADRIAALLERIEGLEKDREKKTAEIDALIRAEDRARTHLEVCEGRARDLEQQVMSLMRELIARGQLPPRAAPNKPSQNDDDGA